MNEPLLRLAHLDTGYGRGRRAVAASRDLSATLHPGTLTLLLGPNGAGKSTLLRTLSGLQPPLGGEVLWQGHDVRHITPRQLARTVGVVLTARPDTGSLTVADVVRLGRMPYGSLLGGTTEADHEAVSEALRLTHTQAFAQRPLHSLSDGERQRVLLAKALAQQTPAILLDEATAFLDFPSKIATLRLLRHLAHTAGRTLLLSTHDVELALPFADHLWLLGGGTLHHGTPQQLAADGSMARFFSADGVRFNAHTLRFDYLP